ncbi:MAG: DUF4337 domain-containing protein [Pseudomonadales bacterium]|nr:DUF4337 domain-containing protein [Pseudomonadales bacterium]
MAEDKQPWMNWMALSTVIIAVCATLSTGKSGGFSTHAVLAQSKASDQWAYYQAKGVKENLYAMEVERMGLRLKTEKLGQHEQLFLQDYLTQIKSKVKKYADQKKAIAAKAQVLEKERDLAQRQGKPFASATIVLQIAIMLSSVAGLLKKQPLWWAGLLAGLWGLILFADGFFMFF